ncbi:MAG: Ig-like domain-containing protein [Calditrichia bacterium]
MSTRKLIRFLTAITATIFLLIAGCERSIDGLENATYPANGDVFLDGFSAGLNYAAFGGSNVDAFEVDWDVKYKGTQSMRIEVPNLNNPEGSYAGGVLFTDVGRDLSGYDALTFWAKASKGATLDVVGFGNDFGASKFLTMRTDLMLNTNWQKFVIPIPLPGKLKMERGMFFYSEGPEDNFGYTIWFDEIQFEKLGTIAHPQPMILDGENQTANVQVGDLVPIENFSVTFNLSNGTDREVVSSPGYFTFFSSDENVATVDEYGVVTVVDSGSATITAALGSEEASGSLTVNVVEAPPAPAAPAPTPTEPASNVISLFSNAYSNVPIDTWNTGWQFSTTQLEEVQINGDDVKLYTDLNFVGIEFASQTIDASAMDRFHIDIWTPDSTAAPAAFLVKLIDFGADGVFGGGDDSEHEISFNENSSPPLQTGSWVSLDVPLSEFTGLTSRAHLAQMVLSGDPNTVYVDNVYLYNSGSTPAEPAAPAPAPAFPAADVISLFSNAYTSVTVDTWSADWDNADVSDVQIAGNDVKLYTNLVFAGIEFTSQPIDASAMTHFYMDIWTPDPTASPAIFKIKLVDFGADGIFGGGDDVEHELTFDANSTPALVTGSWVNFNIPLSDFTGLVTKGHLAQLIFSSDMNTVYVDNVLLHK